MMKIEKNEKFVHELMCVGQVDISLDILKQTELFSRLQERIHGLSNFVYFKEI